MVSGWSVVSVGVWTHVGVWTRRVLLASVASPVTDHVNGENIYLDLCLTLCSMMRMLSKYVRTYGGHFISHMRTQM